MLTTYPSALTLRVEIPPTYATATTCTNARSDLALASSNHSGKYEPCRNFGIRNSTEPTRVFQRRVS